MDDIGEKLASLLNDPDTMSQVKQMAEEILGNGENNDSASDITKSAGILGGDEISSLISAIGRLKSSGNDPRTQLLKALKPHLSEPRREKVDTAIKILKAVELLPLIKESGLLKDIF